MVSLLIVFSQRKSMFHNDVKPLAINIALLGEGAIASSFILLFFP